MSFSWSSITAGTTTLLATQANEVRTNANTMITLMTANSSKCSGYSCSSLASYLPASVTAGTSPVNGSWLSNMQRTADLLDEESFCAAARYSYQASQCSSQHSTVYSYRHSYQYGGNYGAQRGTYCTSAKATYQGVNYHDDWDGLG